MKLFVILSALVVMTIAEDIVYFTSDDDYLDIDSLMNQPLIAKEIIDCLVDRAPCYYRIQSYKNKLAEVIFTACHRCNDPQKKLANRFLMALKVKYPEYYRDFDKKYDPDNIYLPILENAVSGYVKGFKMKIILLLAIVGAALAGKIDFFSTADDYLDMEAVVNDPAKLKAMTDCFLDRGPCDPVAQSYKIIIPESMAHACGRCNDAQKHLANTYLRGLFWKIPEDYDNFLKKFDPQGIFLDKFMEAVKDY
ncbi:uncharacterized protein LOC110997583 [Pieris rapae]|uniref:uncharacterized protein LOC110997583 n=1 Tax=Pieris rapae TaxID=64459 RepID=UPI001E280EAD|nr:uncharacterized protein LOC110997583 [Pieris rapae]